MIDSRRHCQLSLWHVRQANRKITFRWYLPMHHLCHLTTHSRLSRGTDKTQRQPPPLFNHVFSARQHICYSALYAIARPSVRLSVTRVDQSKRVEVRIMHATFTTAQSE